MCSGRLWTFYGSRSLRDRRAMARAPSGLGGAVGSRSSLVQSHPPFAACSPSLRIPSKKAPTYGPGTGDTALSEGKGQTPLPSGAWRADRAQGKRGAWGGAGVQSKAGATQRADGAASTAAYAKAARGQASGKGVLRGRPAQRADAGSGSGWRAGGVCGAARGRWGGRRDSGRSSEGDGAPGGGCPGTRGALDKCRCWSRLRSAPPQSSCVPSGHCRTVPRLPHPRPSEG